MSKSTRYSPEVKERAVRLVFEQVLKRCIEAGSSIAPPTPPKKV